jgi:3-oxoadipate enol-lactonase
MSSRGGPLAVDRGVLYYEVTGAGPPVVFLHGFGLDCRMWAPQWQALSSQDRWARYDSRGFGRSSLPQPSPYAHEHDLHALLLHLDALPAHVVGLSMGGRFALRFALGYPAAVRSLVLVDSALDGHRWSEPWRAEWAAITALAQAGDIEGARQRWLAHALFSPARANSAVVPLLASMVQAYSGWHWHSADSARIPAPSCAERLAEIKAPALVVVGEHDLPDFQQIAARLGTGLQRAKQLVVPGAGHMVNLEAPDAFNLALGEFWKTAMADGAA